MPDNLDYTICPFMSTDKSEIYCGGNCELYNEQFERCSIFIVGQMSGLQVQDILLNLQIKKGQ